MILFFFVFFFTFPKTWVGRAMGNEIFHGDGLTKKRLKSIALSVCQDVRSDLENLESNDYFDIKFTKIGAKKSM